MAETVTFLLHLFLVYALHIQGSSAVTPVFVQTGKDLILNLTEAEVPPNIRVWSWQFINNAMITFTKGSPPHVEESHTGRIEVLKEKNRVRLKNLQKSDSGIYAASALLPTLQKLSEYNVTVQDPVSLADLTLTSSSDSSSCILSVTCRAGNSSISSILRCKNQICNQEGGETRGVTESGASLQTEHWKGSIVCNHSNQVSWTELIKRIEDHCPQRGENRIYWYILIIVFLVAATGFAFIAHHKCKKGNNHSADNTIYALPEMKDQAEKLKETADNEASSPTTTYSTVGLSISTESTKTRGNDQPESLYAMIEKPDR